MDFGTLHAFSGELAFQRFHNRPSWPLNRRSNQVVRVGLLVFTGVESDTIVCSACWQDRIMSRSFFFPMVIAVAILLLPLDDYDDDFDYQ